MLPAVTDPATDRKRAVLLAVQRPEVSDAEFESSLFELKRLAKTLGLVVIGQVTQKRRQLATGAVVGGGKLEELAGFTGGSGVVSKGPPGKRGSDPDEDDASDARDAASPSRTGRSIEYLPEAERAVVVLVDHDITPTQNRNLERATGAEVLDRSAVILAIFQRHARSREARLQVEIARLIYLAPRLRESGGGKDRQGGGIGGRGAGESGSELDRRKVRDRIAALRAELESIDSQSDTRRKRRDRENTVALVGYTNAGKSSAMRALTGSGILVADKLFATLDTTVRALAPETTPRILVSDTVGFIKKLPHDLVASFRSTLDEARDADLLIHLADASDPDLPAQIDVARRVLADVGATESPRVLVLNKIDRVAPDALAQLARDWPDALQLSVKDETGVALLRESIVAFFERDMVDEELHIPYRRQKVVGEAYASCRVLSEQHDETGTRLRIRARPDVIDRLRAAI